MQNVAYPSTLLKNVGWTVQGELPVDDTPPEDIDYFNVLILEPTATRENRVLIIQLPPDGNHMAVSAQGLEEFCKGHKFVQPGQNTAVYYFDNAGDFCDQYSSSQLTSSGQDSGWNWSQNDLTMKKLAAAVQIPTYLLAEKLEVFDTDA